MNKSNDWNDLRSRLTSGLILLFISGFCIFLGGYFFTVFVILLVGVMHWEMGKMLSPISTQAMWFSAVLSIIVIFYLVSSQSLFWSLLMLLINFHFQKNFFHHNSKFGAIYSLAVIICGIVFYKVRLELGLSHTVWLIGIVVVTDTAGFIIGRTIGGPKVFPRISPKKTWSGVLAGWLAVGLFSWAFVENVAPQNLFFTFVSISILLSVAAQIGDMIQSHLKRKSAVKDSSNLLPGHGGFMDRFDVFIGATIVTGFVFEWIY